MADYYQTLEPPAKSREEELKDQSMICNESLQIPKTFSLAPESGLIKSSFHELPKQLQVNPIKLPLSRFSANVEERGARRMEMSPPFETPKRLRRKILNPIPRADRSTTLRGLVEMDPYAAILDDTAMLHNPEYGRGEREGQTVGVAEKVKKWVKYEFFYSSIDKPYFESSELQEYLSLLKIPYKTLRRADFILIRKAIGKPRRLSHKFLERERQRLHKYREIAREVIPYTVPLPLL
eukprot:TRINITY_DN9403_c0_g2_i1.p1 TRINITY_DN9403_c0_g2~~TRINITY_DN9403_c0_g2_i1.p1  ORF type:complete len:237 (+),score=64.23 TRINITY_DN9403_c0_g2_i1:426-1136(+)